MRSTLTGKHLLLKEQIPSYKELCLLRRVEDGVGAGEGRKTKMTEMFSLKVYPYTLNNHHLQFWRSRFFLILFLTTYRKIKKKKVC